jgi:hypothetical protein
VLRSQDARVAICSTRSHGHVREHNGRQASCVRPGVCVVLVSADMNTNRQQTIANIDPLHDDATSRCGALNELRRGKSRKTLQQSRGIRKGKEERRNKGRKTEIKKKKEKRKKKKEKRKKKKEKRKKKKEKRKKKKEKRKKKKEKRKKKRNRRQRGSYDDQATASRKDETPVSCPSLIDRLMF